MRNRSDAKDASTDSAAGATGRAARKAARQASADVQAAERAAKKAATRAENLARAAAKTAAKEAKALGESEAKASRSEAKAARKDAKAARKDAKKATRSARSAKREAKAAAKAADAATKPARAIAKLTDPKLAKRAVTVGKVLAPALAPVLLKAATRTRGFLDQQRAHRLGVPVEQVGDYRGPTGAIGARLTGLGDSIRELAQRRGNDLQVTRFTEVAGRRLLDLTATVQAAASMPRGRRTDVLRAVGHELDGIDADLIALLMSRRGD